MFPHITQTVVLKYSLLTIRKAKRNVQFVGSVKGSLDKRPDT